MTSRNDYRYPSTMNRNTKQSNIHVQPNDSLRYNPWEFENPWSHNLCNCTEQCDETCYGLWCFPCFTCHLAWRMNESCWITCCLPGYLAVLRTKMRTAFRIKGSYLSDFCAAEFCPCCTAFQMASELRFRKIIT
ncbi:unnamed protein product [Rotaria sordida]|uniref:Cornifelin n=1 Tax=Rotaria sordida TaxID=392033 RepID=A0A819EVC5_9BILA|nr:unnamed protein product [Rotaria sordida]CAF3857289.1 unnamed protein product [Rotaria sordida]